MKKTLEPWKLRLSHDTDWGKCYTGVDPALEMPEGLSEEKSMRYIKAFARFADTVPDTINSFSLRLLEADKEIGKRFSFNTHIPNVSRRTHNLLNYMQKTGGYSNKQMAEFGIQCYPSYVYESSASVAELFARECATNSNISARGYLEHLGNTIKNQYVEPELLYIGQCLNETAEAIAKHGFSAEDQEMIAQLKSDYMNSGLSAAVNDMRVLANTKAAKSQTRRSYVDKPRAI